MVEPEKKIIQREKLIQAGQMHLVHWLIVLLSIVLTFTAWQFSRLQLNQKLETKFHRNAEQVVNSVKERMKLYENALWSSVAFIDAVDTPITYRTWLSYSRSLKIDATYPGINGIGVIYNIQPPQLDSYLLKQRELRPHFSIHPKHHESEYWPITYIEPALPNQKAIGLDMAFEKNRYVSIQKARDSGQAQLTGPITLVQDAKKTPGFLFYTPFYENGAKPDNLESRRALIEGVTYAPFIMKNLMQGTLAEKYRHVSIQIHDNGQLLFDDHADRNLDDVDQDPLFSKEEHVELYGRVWTFSIQSNLAFRNEFSSNQSAFILIGGLVIDALLLTLFLLLTKANREALAYADKITQALKEKTLTLEKSNSDLEQFSYVASHDLKSPLNAIKNLVEWITEDCQNIIPDESKKHLALLTQRTDRMMRLLDDLLEYSRINRNKFKNEPVNLKDISTDVFSMQDKTEGFTLSAPDVEIAIPKTPLEIVLRNLISNAIKHHESKSGAINVLYESNPDYHIIIVEDDGPGIPLELHEKALEMFQTLKPRDKVEGSGMGLAMIKRIVEHYKGKILITSDGKHGTKISIYWPLSNS